ncbi:MAG: hypothetical protein FIA99_14755 [Ruminiclostridium sp.]|nr:hypothetical protein [Ruminiclostridium sp.]
MKSRMKPRSVVEIAGSFLVSIPRQYADLIGIEKGSKINISLNEDGKLMITPARPAKTQADVSNDPRKRGVSK